MRSPRDKSGVAQNVILKLFALQDLDDQLLRSIRCSHDALCEGAS